MSAFALTLTLPACAACARAEAGRVVRPGEVVIGRASVADGVVLLTSDSVLVHVDNASRIRRVTLETPPAKLWGLGSIGEQLYSIAGFVDLVRISSEGRVQRVARYERPVANLVDLPAGIGAQPAVDHPGTPLLWSSDEAAHLSPVGGATRRSLSLPRAEEGVLHLLSCSAPARVVCWLPGSDEVLSLDERGLLPAVRLDTVRRVAPARLITQPNRRAIHDAAQAPGGSFIVLFDRDGRDAPALAEFESSGKLLRWLESPARVRMILDVGAARLRVILASGRLVEIRL